MSDRKQNVLLTGATGFLGSHILKELRDHPTLNVIAACRSPERLPDWFGGEVRQGDLTDAAYREELFSGVDIVLHVGTWATFWGHSKLEKEKFFNVAKHLTDLSVVKGVKKFAVASTIAVVADKWQQGVDDFAPAQKSGFWPHLDYLIELDAHMQSIGSTQTNMTSMRLGHFVGEGNKLGVVPALLPRLKTFLVPWLNGGKNRLPLISGQDMAKAFVRFCETEQLQPYESFNICHKDRPTMREVVDHMSEVGRVPRPIFSVPFWAAYVFGWLMEALHPVLPGKAPFLTRSLIRVSEDRDPSIAYAKTKLGFVAKDDWRKQVKDSVGESQQAGFPWPALAQA